MLGKATGHINKSIKMKKTVTKLYFIDSQGANDEEKDFQEKTYIRKSIEKKDSPKRILGRQEDVETEDDKFFESKSRKEEEKLSNQYSES